MPNLKARWNRFANSRAGTDAYLSLTSSHLSLTRVLLPVVDAHARGRVLDLGAGYGTYRPALTRHGSSYVGLDIQPKPGTIDLLADGRRLPFAPNQFDTVFCSQVLEHTPEPWQLIQEADRVLAPGGVFIVSAPHLSYIHAAPEDYYRYTRLWPHVPLESSGIRAGASSTGRWIVLAARKCPADTLSGAPAGKARRIRQRGVGGQSLGQSFLCRAR